MCVHECDDMRFIYNHLLYSVYMCVILCTVSIIQCIRCIVYPLYSASLYSVSAVQCIRCTVYSLFSIY